MTTVGTLTAVFTADTSDFTRGLSEVNRALNNTSRSISQKISGMGNSFMGLGASTSAVTAPLAGIAGYSIKAAVEFESAFAGVVKTVDESEEVLNELRETIREMATSEDNPLAGLENAHVIISELVASGAQLGVPTDGLAEFAQVTGELGIATNVTAQESGVLLARIGSLTNLPVDEYRNFGSAVVELGNNMATTEGEILAITNRIAATSELVGLSESIMLAYSATMSSLGVTAELGGTNFSKLLTTITEAVATGDKLDAFASIAGESADVFAQAWGEDANEALLSFLEGLGQLNAEEQIVALNELGLTGTEMQRVVLSLANNYDELENAISLSTNAWEENTALSKEAANRFATTEAQMNLTKNTVKDLAIEIGDALLPVINDLLQEISPIIRKLTDWAKENPKLVRTILIVGSALAGFGVSLLAIGGFLSAVAPVFSALGAVLAALLSPIGLIVAALVALGVAYKTNLFGFKDAVDSVVSGITGALPGVVAFINDIINALYAGDFSGAFQSIKDQLVSLAASILPALKSGLSSLAGFMLNNVVIPLANEVANYVSSGQLYENLKTLGDNILFAIKQGIILYANYLNFLYTNVIVPLADEASNFIASGRLFEVMKQLGNSVMVAIESGLRLYANFYTFIFNNIILPLGDQVVSYISQGTLFENLKSLGSSVMDAIRLGITSFVGFASFINDNVISPLIQQINDSVDSLFESAKALGTSIIDGVIDGLQSAASSLSSIFKSLINSAIPDNISLTLSDPLGILGSRQINVSIPQPFPGHREGTPWTGYGPLSGVAGFVHFGEAVVPNSGAPLVFPSPKGLIVKGGMPSQNIVINGNIVLPNVKNNKDFARELMRTVSRLSSDQYGGL